MSKYIIHLITINKRMRIDVKETNLLFEVSFVCILFVISRPFLYNTTLCMILFDVKMECTRSDDCDDEAMKMMIWVHEDHMNQ